MRKPMLSAILLASFAALLALPGSAAAASPWWQLSSGSRPSVINPGSARDEVQELTVEATGGTYTLTSYSDVENSFSPPPHETTAPIPFNASAAALRTALEALPIVGPGGVTVTGGPAPASPYTITFTGFLARQPVPILSVDSTKLTGGAKRATVTELSKGRPDGYVVLGAENLGNATVEGQLSPVTIADALPAGLKPLGITATASLATEPASAFGIGAHPFLPCAPLPELRCELNRALLPFDFVEIRIAVEVLSGAESGEQNELAISGGATAAASLRRPLTYGEQTPFGFEDFRASLEAEGGTLDARAGAHPFQFTTTVAINQARDESDIGLVGEIPKTEPAALAKDVYTKLPPGLIGNPTPFAACSLAQFLVELRTVENACPQQSALGIASVTVNEPALFGQIVFTMPLFNLEPYFGEPARLGFFVSTAGLPVLLGTSLRSGAGEGAVPGQSEDYGLDVNALNITQHAGLTSARITVWGTPGAKSHESMRGWGCLSATHGVAASERPACLPAEEAHPPAFLTMPSTCAAPLQTSVEADAWIDPKPLGQGVSSLPSEALPSLKGCNQLPFTPTIHAEPTSNAATSPTGFNFDLYLKDEGFTNSEGRAESELKKAVVTLPQGFTTNPSVAEGLKACSRAEYNATTLQPGSGCTEESKIGLVEVESPAVRQTVKGSLFVAKQRENPNDNLLTLYMVLRNPELGVLAKQALKVIPDPVTGQLTTELDNIPQLPISHFHLAFRPGQRSPLITPPACGQYTVKADLYPYSEPNAPLHKESSFQITEGPEGLPCPSGGLPPFHPGLEAGSQNNAAGHYSPFYIHMTRKDSEQEITHFSIKLPPGVLGKLAGIPFCSDAQIAAAKAREHEGGGQEELNAPSCPAASEIGHTLVGTGVGNVLAYAPGKVYLAGPYHGSAISVAAITAGVVGPFDLGTVVVREALRVNPETGEVFVDATGSDPIPHIVDGIATHLRDIRVYMDRPEFVLNPTGCEPTSTASTLLGSGLDFSSEADDRPVTVSSPYQAADCAALAFKPKLSLKLKGGTKRGGHPSFSATLRMKGSGESNIKRAQVTLPGSEFLANAHIKTICTRVQFRAEACPAGSIYGHASATTPILSEPLTGPVFLRSSEHELPDLVAELKNGEITIDLVGHIDSLNGRIRNTFEAAPDAPVKTFTLTMQGAKKGLLENSTNLCKGTHRAIADFTAHNGKVSDFNPPLVANCPKARKAKGKAHKQKHRAG
jgi:hypothetical protein